MNQQEAGQRRLRTMLAVIVLLLLQIFNGVDWNCRTGSSHAGCDAGCRAEHWTELTCEPDMSSLLAAAWLLVPPGRFSFPPAWNREKNTMTFQPLKRLFQPREGSAGLPPEEPVPQRC